MFEPSTEATGVSSTEIPSACEAAEALLRADVSNRPTVEAATLSGVAMYAVTTTEPAARVIVICDGSTSAIRASETLSKVVFS